MSRPPKRVLEAIEQGKIAPGYALLGREVYWRDRIWAALRNALGADPGSAVAEFDLRHASVEMVAAAAGERNLWAPRQLVLVRNAQLLTAAKGLPILAEYFRDPSPFAVCVFEMSDLDLQSEDWREREKAKARQEDWEPICDLVLLSRPAMGEWIELIQQEAGARGRAISREAAECLATLLDRDLGRAVQEVEKLCLQSQGEVELSTPISTQEISSVVGPLTPAAQPLTDAIGSGQPAQALDALARAIQQDAYLPLLVSELARYLRQLLLLQQGGARDSRNAARVLWAAKLPAPQNLLPELVRQARAFTSDHLVDCLRLAAQADLALRSSPADARLIVEEFVLRIMKPLRREPLRPASGAPGPFPQHHA